MARPTHHKWQTPHQKQQYSNSLEPTEWERTRIETGYRAAGANLWFQDRAPLLCLVWLMARTPVLIALRRAHAARCSWMHVHLLTAPLKDPFTAQMRSKSKKFRRKLPSLYFFIYFCKINSRSLETQVCHIHDLQPTTQTLEDNKQKANAHKLFSCTSADTA